MLNIFKKIILFSVFSLLIICPTTSFAWHDYDGYWDYHGSGRDHPYSDYIDRYYYIGYADYAPLEPDFVDEAPYINNITTPPIIPASVQPITQVLAAPVTQPDEFT